ncbi:archaetidylserine decarboxylase [Anaeromyxobacter oryzae]|uniref:Phosphatidylserine decarboxylase proenzyme n=1 Tax=Anaeromyxobacter oryzae TaxID=2918170 RepID=A0ABN6MZH2_9BACT|nr:archaetidylserine decarboxylase [Anaeromyxobacter oryzae]BDG06362.1 phosphatidylserine decarboxylase proenzyme [Anaeromyxobacter oryzae]
MNDRLFISALALIPKNGLSRLAGALTRWRAPAPVRLAAMRAFARRYGIDLSECPDLDVYRTFGEFFARPLRPGLRPVAPGDAAPVSPVDGVVSEAGLATGGRLVQAKGIDYTAAALLGDAALARRLAGGAYATIYLSPKDYHRIHFPLGGRVTGYRYVPGKLWPVNPASVRTVPGLFSVNERLVTVTETPVGACAIVAVGATVVGRVRAYYDPTVPFTNAGAPFTLRDYERPIPVEKGQELGAFEMGSTVILMFEPGKVRLDPRLVSGARVRVGELIGAAG